MPRRVFLTTTGGPEVLQVETFALGRPGPRQVRLCQSACGVNFVDIYMRSGLYPLSLPSGLGLEAVGTIEDVGTEVTTFKAGDRVVYGNGPLGAYASERLISPETLITLPDALDDISIAATMLRGLTVHFLIHRVFKVEPGMTVLFHAAAGGLGLLACQWLKALGATVIGTVSSDSKAATAQAYGCSYPIVYTREDFVARVREITDGRGVPVVYDGIGQESFEKSLDCLAPQGTMVTFGNASGPVKQISPQILANKGSLFLTRPRLSDYTTPRSALETGARAFFDIVLSGQVKLMVGQHYGLHEAGQAHQDLQSRKTTGATVLIP